MGRGFPPTMRFFVAGDTPILTFPREGGRAVMQRDIVSELNRIGRVVMAYLVTPDGVPLYYEDEGPRESRAIFLIHAEPFNTKFWQKNIGPMSEEMRVVSMDVRGRGESGKTDQGLTLTQYAHDFRFMLERLGLERVVAAGWSMGSAILWRIRGIVRGRQDGGVRRRGPEAVPVSGLGRPVGEAGGDKASSAGGPSAGGGGLLRAGGGRFGGVDRLDVLRVHEDADGDASGGGVGSRTSRTFGPCWTG